MDKDGEAGGTPTGTQTLNYLVAALWFGLTVAAVATALSFHTQWVAAFGVGLLIFVSAFAAGSGLGFLFGVPRVPASDARPATTKPDPTGATPTKSSPDTTGPADQQDSGRVLLHSNTNLERISDWLTTMLVGATLVQLYKINDLLVGFREFLSSYARVFSDSAHAPNAGILPAIGPVILILGAVTGFLFMYLNTRLILIRFFYGIEKLLSGEKLTQRLSNRIRSTIADAGSSGDFVQRVLSLRPNLSVQDALDAMRDALYRPEGYLQSIQVGATLSNTSAIRSAWYWYLLAAAFGQQYDAAKAAEDKASARDNALDAARRAISLNASYRAGLRALTDPKSADNDLANLYKDDPRLKDLLDQA
jgi:hypothetical protein